MQRTEFLTTVRRSSTAKASERSLTFTASTQSLDRGSDRVLGPWQLTAFRKNPVILFAHDYKSLPIGRATSIFSGR
jgi:hypothetical protein